MIRIIFDNRLTMLLFYYQDKNVLFRKIYLLNILKGGIIMKKTLSTVACALTIIMSVPVIGNNSKLGQISVDVVSAATGDTTSPVTQTPPKTTPTKTPIKSTSTKTTSTPVKSSSKITRMLTLNSTGSDVALLQTMLNKNGYKLKVDGIFGKLTLAAVKNYQSKNALVVDGVVGPKTLARLSPVVTPIVTQTPVKTIGKTTIKIGKAEYAAHGTKCFTVAVVAMSGDKIVDVIIDDYQVMAKDGTKSVPNSDADFGANLPEGKVLASKLANADTYSKNMKEKGGATLSVNENFKAVETFAIGKTIAQLEAVVKTNSEDPLVDAVSGATLADTNGYLDAIIAAAKSANGNRAIEIDETALKSVKIGKVEYAAHGSKCYTVASVVMVGDKIVGAIIDDYQVMAKDGTEAVPNSDDDFGGNFPAGKVLGSKLANADAYSKNMKEKGGATLSVNQNFNAVESFVIGKTIAQLEEIVKTNSTDPLVDAVSGATLVDTNGYLSAIIAAAKDAKIK